MFGFAFAEGVSGAVSAVFLIVVVAWLGWVIVEVRRSERSAVPVVVSAVLAAVVLLGALQRPVRVSAR